MELIQQGATKLRLSIDVMLEEGNNTTGNRSMAPAHLELAYSLVGETAISQLKIHNDPRE